MLEKKINYTDFKGNKRSETHYFNLSKTEIAELDMNESQIALDGGITGGLEEKLNSIRAGGKGSEILKAFKEIIFLSYGQVSEDGRRLIKSAALSEEFSQTPAYDEFFQEIISDSAHAASLINEILPPEFAQGGGADKARAQAKTSDQPTHQPKSPAQRAEEEAKVANEGPKVIGQVKQPSAPTEAPAADTSKPIPAGTTPEEYQEYLDWQARQARKNESGE